MTKKEAHQLLLDSDHIQYRKGRYCKSGIYTLYHGEYERPDYQIRKVRGKDDCEIYCRVYFYSGTFNNDVNHVLSNDDIAALRISAMYIKENYK